MPKITTPLTDTEIKKSKPKDKQYKLSDGAGLCIIITSKGSKYFRFDYSFNGKRKSISFGTYPQTSLKDARIKRDEAKEFIKNGIDPSHNKKIEKKEINNFEDIAMQWFSKMKDEWADITYNKALQNFKNNCFPVIGYKSIKDITRIDILDMLKIMENKGIYELQNKLINYLSRIYKYAVTYNYAEHNIIADIDKRDVIKQIKVKHFSALTKPKEIKQFMDDLHEYGNNYRSDIATVYALQFAPYVFIRPQNIRNFEWDEVDMKKGVWDIPGHKMKTGKDFIIPLPKQALEILEKIKPYSYHKSKYVFPSPTSNLKTISENTLNQAIMRMGYKDRMTSHGFRGMFSTTAHEHIKDHGHHSDVIEFCLAHEETNKVKSAYDRSSKMKYFDERKELIQWYANWLDSL